MAAILDPKTRFFDTYLTKEGRRQLSSGELQMRYVSFSDGLTSYEESESGVIDSKDGSIFFEAMSRPQDKIITENPSIVNMMSITDPGRQPAFLYAKDEDGNRTNDRIEASLFGDQLILPPDGRVISASTTAGVDRVDVRYDLNIDMYSSSSLTQEVGYKNSSNLRGWWVFEDEMSQIATAGLTFKSENILAITTDASGDTASTASGVFQFKTAADTYVWLKNIPAINSINVYDEFVYGAFKGRVSEALINHSRGDGGIRVKITNKSGTPTSVDRTTTGTIGAFLKSNYAVSENLKLKSSLATNASYFKIDENNDHVSDGSIVFANEYVKGISNEVNKSYTAGNGKAIRIPLEQSYYGIDKFPGTWPTPPGGHPVDRFMLSGSYTENAGIGNQLSTWFYIKQAGYASGNEQSVMQIFSTTTGELVGGTKYPKKYECIRIWAVEDDLKLMLTRPGFNTPSPVTLSLDNKIVPNKWHRVSIAWNYHKIALILDGNLETSIIRDFESDDSYKGKGEFASEISHYHRPPAVVSDVVLGNKINNMGLNNTTIAFVNNTYLDGYIQSCEYYVDASEQPSEVLLNPNREPTGNISLRNTYLPVFNNATGSNTFYQYSLYEDDLANRRIGSDPIYDNFATGSIVFASPFDSNFLNNTFTITLGDTLERQVTFTSDNTINAPVRTNGTSYKFAIPDYNVLENRSDQNSRNYLAEQLHAAIVLANGNGDLSIESTVVRAANDNPSIFPLGMLSLRQSNAGATGDSKITVVSQTLESVVKQDFTGGAGESQYVWVRSASNSTADGENVSIPRTSTVDDIYLDYFNKEIEVDSKLNSWVNFYQISSEACLFQSAMSGSAYAKEKFADKDEIFPDISELAEASSLVMSGTIDSYKDLILLEHLDLEKSDENQGFKVTRYHQEQELFGNEATGKVLRGTSYSKDDVRIFKTRFDNYKYLEHVYGQKNLYDNNPLTSILSMDGPASGLFFEKESSYLNLEEIIDNDLDESEETKSSTRLPNFFFLPPISKQNFIFESNPDDEDPFNVSWRKALRDILDRVERSQPRQISLGPAAYKNSIDNDFQGILPFGLIEDLTTQHYF